MSALILISPSTFSESLISIYHNSYSRIGEVLTEHVLYNQEKKNVYQVNGHRENDDEENVNGEDTDDLPSKVSIIFC